MSKIQNDLRLLPTKFKIIGLTIMSLSILFKALPISELLTIDKELIKTISTSGILISLLLLALTRNKIEDELTLKIRLKGLAVSFIYGVGMVIIEPFMNLLFDGEFFSEKGTTELLMSMFFFYFIMVFIMKRKR